MFSPAFVNNTLRNFPKLFAASLSPIHFSASKKMPEIAEKPNTIYQFHALDINGKDVSMDKYK
jgi:hypothetical protein